MSLMRSRPLRISGYNQPGFGGFLGRLLFLALVAGLVAALVKRSVKGIVIAGILAIALVILKSGRRRTLQLMVSTRGIKWIHPERGTGNLAWNEIGALVVRDSSAGEELAVYLVPRGSEDPDNSDGGFSGFILATSDTGKRGPEGEEKLKLFVEQIARFLKTDVTLDRGTRRWLEKWQVRICGGGGNSKEGR